MMDLIFENILALCIIAGGSLPDKFKDKLQATISPDITTSFSIINKKLALIFCTLVKYCN